MTPKKIAALLAVMGFAAPALATNGMNMEGYGPIATGMGGASYAYDNGTAGLINNPATLALMASGTARLDLAIGGLHPDVTTKMNGMPNADSDGTAYYMPAIGYVRKDAKLTYGVGMMAQGGMGTEYGSSSFLSGFQSAACLVPGAPCNQGQSGQANRSELGIGRVMFPLAFDVSDSLRVGGTLDYLWGGLDLQMVMPGAMFAQFTGFGGAPASPLGSAGGSLVGAFGNPAFGIQDVNWAQFDFSEGSNKMKQRLTTNGWAGNIGFVWKASPQLSVGGVYHAKTNLDDMEGNGAVKVDVATLGGPMTLAVNGKLKIVDFQWPETYGIGVAYKVNDRLMVAADYKRIGWAKVMKDFRMQFTAEGNGGMLEGLNGTSMDATLFQNWDNQDVFMIGATYHVSDALVVRVGANLADNPIPDAYMNPLFPAIVKDHYTVGFGYNFSKASSIDFSFAYAPEVSQTNNNMGVTTTHSQTNWQFMFSQRF